MTYQPGAALPMVEIHVMEHGLLMLAGGGIYRLGDHWYPGDRGRLHLDGALLPAVVRRARQDAREISHLQRLEPPSAADEIDHRSRPTRAANWRRSPRFSDAPAPAVTRVVFSEADLRARATTSSACAPRPASPCAKTPSATPSRAGPAPRPNLPAVGTGSHIDAIPNAGRYDGTVGVLGGLEAIRALQRAGFRPRRSIELLIFTAEEPTRFGIGCLGSRLLAGLLDATRRRPSARSARAHARRGPRRPPASPGRSHGARCPPGYYSAFVELHIEQGPLLERAGHSARHRDRDRRAGQRCGSMIEGEGGHAGAVLMPDRHDAFLAAAEIALAVERAARSTGAIDTVGTVGRLRGLSRRGQQHSQPRAPGNRRARYR